MDESEFKLTEEEKLQIIDDILQSLAPQYPLPVSISEEVNTKQASNTTMHSYSILGSNLSRRTQNTNLQQKVDDFNKNFQQKASEQSSSATEEDPQNFRFYKQNVRCFRCRRTGHYNTSCPQQFCCIYCLSFLHTNQKCPQKIVCYRCYSFGHVINDCSKPQGPYCANCKRKHYDSCFFLTKGIQQIKQMFNADILYNSQQIRCMVCLNYGHITCQNNRENYDSKTTFVVLQK